MAVLTAPNTAPIPSREKAWDKVWDKTQPQLKSANRKRSAPLLVALVIATILLAVSGVWRATHNSPSVAWVKVVAAGRDIPAGARLGFTTLRYLDVPKQFVTPDMVRSLNDATDRVTKTFIPTGEPIKASILFSGHDGLSLNLETDERAITLQLTDDTLVDHSIQPDDRVDVLAISSKDGKKYTRTICQAARVLMSAPKEEALSRHLNNSANKITLALTPDLAEAVTEATEVGKIRLLLRNRLSRAEQSLKGVSQRDLLPNGAMEDSDSSPLTKNAMEHNDSLPPPPVNVQEPPLPLAERPLQWMVEVISGSHKETYGVPQQ